MKTSSAPRRHFIVAAVIAAVFAAAVTSPIAAERTVSNTQPTKPSYPDAFFKAVPGSDRLRNPEVLQAARRRWFAAGRFEGSFCTDRRGGGRRR